MQNRYPGNCAFCAQRVPAGGGIAFKEGNNWRVRHDGPLGACAAAVEPYNPLGQPGDSWIVHGLRLTLQADGTCARSAERMIGENDAEFDTRSRVDARLHTASTAAAADRMQIGARDYHIPDTSIDIDAQGALTDAGAEHLSRLIAHDKTNPVSARPA